MGSATSEGTPRPHEQVVEAGLQWGAVAILVPNLLLSTVRSLSNPGVYVPGFAALVLLALWSATGCAVVLRRRRGSAVVPLRAAVVVGALALLLHAWLQSDTPDKYPPLLHVIGATAAVSPVLGVRLSYAVIPAIAAGVAAVRADDLGAAAAASEALLLAVSAFIATVTVGLVRGAAGNVVGAVGLLSRERDREFRARRRAYEREHWNGLVHDKVIGALQLVAQDGADRPPALARELAGQALIALRGDAPDAGRNAREILADHAALLGLRVDWDLRGVLPDGEVGTAILDAAKEALTNVSRHAGTDRVAVRGRLFKDRAWLEVADAGRGFASFEGVGQHGVATSILRRTEGVGGTATLTSVPGGGTTVLLQWERPEAVPDIPTTDEWQLRTFAPAMILGAACLVLNVVMGRPQWALDRWPPLTYGCIAAIIAITAASTLLKPSGATVRVLVAAAVAVCGALTLSIPAGTVTDWRYWFIGALTPAVGAVAFRFRRGTGLWMATGVTAAVCLGDAVGGRPLWSSLAGPVPVLFVLAWVSNAIRRSMDDAWQRVTTAEQEQAAVRRATDAENERAREAAARVAALSGPVTPYLQRILDNQAIGDRDRDEVRLLEESVRDHLTWPELLDAALIRELHEARARGVRVSLVDGAPTDRQTTTATVASSASASAFRTMLAGVLTAAPSYASVRAVWGLTGAGVLATVVVHAPALRGGPPPTWDGTFVTGLVSAIPARYRPRVSRDEDALFLELPA